MMKIKDCEYKGFKYSIMFADKGDWREHINHFYTEAVGNFNGGFSKDLEEVDCKIKEDIDNFLSSLPSTDDE